MGSIRDEKVIKELRGRTENKKCMDCSASFPTYVVLDFGTWVCATCSGIHREFSHKVKSPTMSTFKPDELNILQKGGNDKAADVWRAKWRPEEQRVPDAGDIPRIRDFIKATYVDKKWYSSAKKTSSPSTPNKLETMFAPPPSATTSNSSRNSVVQTKELIDWNDEPVVVPNNNNNNSNSNSNPFFGTNTGTINTTPVNNNNPFFTNTNPSPMSNNFGNVQNVTSNNSPFGFPSPFSTNNNGYHGESNPFGSTNNVFGVPQNSFPSPQTPFSGVTNNSTGSPFQNANSPFAVTPSPFANNNNNNINQSNSFGNNNNNNNNSATIQRSTSTSNDFDPFADFIVSSPSQPNKNNTTTTNNNNMNNNINTINNEFAGMTIKGPPPMATIINNSNNNTNNSNNTNNIKKKEVDTPKCPVCSIALDPQLSNAEINNHIDHCLATGGKQPVKQQEEAKEDWSEWFNLARMDWYFGDIDRKEAEKILFKCTEDSFLVRRSSVKDAYAVSLYNQKKQTVIHSLIHRKANGWAFQDTVRTYPTLVDLINESPECKGLKPPRKDNPTFL